MSINFNEEFFSNFFDEKKIYSDEAKIMSYCKKYKDGYVFDIYLNVYENTVIISLNKKTHHINVFDVTLIHIVHEIIVEQNIMKFYTKEHIVLVEISLSRMISLKLSL